MNRLLERQRELAALSAATARLQAGAGSLVVVSGPAGIGKSAVAAQAVQAAASAGITALTATGRERHSGVAYGVAVDLFAAVPDLRPLLVGTARLAAAAFDRDAPPSAADGVTEGLWRLVEHLARDGPVVIWVDDAQWCDESSLRLLERVVAHLTDVAVLVIIGVRLGEALPPGVVRLRDVATRELRLEPLTVAAVATMAAEALDAPASDAFVDACWDATRGNPYLVSDLLRAAAAAGLAPDDTAVAEIRRVGGTTVGARVTARLAAMSPPARRLAQAVAVLGDHAALPDVAAVAQVDVDTATDLAAGLAAAGILMAVEPLRFVHPLVATAVHAAIEGDERASLHAVAVDVLRASGAPPLRLASHLVELAPGDGPQSADTLAAAAAEVSAAGDAALAARYLQRAVREPLPPSREAALRVDLGVAMVTAGDTSGIAQVEQAAGQLEGDERARALFTLGRLQVLLGDRGVAAASFDRGLAAVKDPEGDLAKELRAGYLFAAILHAPLAEEALARLAVLVERDAAAGDTPGERRVLAWRALQHGLTCGDREESLRLARRALDGADITADESADGPFFSLLTGAFVYAGALDEAVDLCDTVLQQARRRGLYGGYATAVYCRATPRFHQGDITGAAADYASAVAAGERGWQLYRVAAIGLYAHALLERNELQEAQRLLDVDHAQWRDRIEYTVLLEAIGALRSRQGRPADALDALLESGRIATAAGMLNPVLSAWRSRASAAAADVGDIVLARRLAAEELELSRQWGAPHGLAQSLCAVAALERGHDRVALLEEAYAATDRTEVQYWRLRAGVALGEALRMAGDAAGARQVLRPLVETAAMGGAVVLRDRAVQELSAAGGRPRRLPSAPLAVLSPAEHQVVTLLTGGLPARDVAEALFITERAVERHLAAAYRKLGVSTRGELTSIVSPRGSAAGEVEPP